MAGREEQAGHKWQPGSSGTACAALSAVRHGTVPQVAMPKPGEADDELFSQHPSVAAWRSWYFSDADYPSTPERCGRAGGRDG